jgi:hypothetical protein
MPQVSETERRRYDAAVDQFMDLLARLIARDHLRQCAADELDMVDDDKRRKKAKAKR